MNFFDGHYFSSPVLLSRNLAKLCRFPTGDVSTKITIGSLILQDRIEFENEAEFRPFLLLAAAERQIGFI